MENKIPIFVKSVMNYLNRNSKNLTIHLAMGEILKRIFERNSLLLEKRTKIYSYFDLSIKKTVSLSLFFASLRNF